MNKQDKNITGNALKHLRFQKDKSWRTLQEKKSLLFNKLEELSKKSEKELTKKELLLLVSINCDYMFALNIYNYYRDEVTKLLISLNESGDNNERR